MLNYLRTQRLYCAYWTINIHNNMTFTDARKFTEKSTIPDSSGFYLTTYVKIMPVDPYFSLDLLKLLTLIQKFNYSFPLLSCTKKGYFAHVHIFLMKNLEEFIFCPFKDPYTYISKTRTYCLSIFLHTSEAK